MKFFKKEIQGIIFLIVVGIMISSTSNVYGHGLGMETIKSIDVNGKEISISVDLPIFFDESGENQLTITTIDDDTKEPAKNVTLLVELLHENEMIFKEYFLAHEGILSIDINPTASNEIEIVGQQDSQFNAWYGNEEIPLSINGPIFESGGIFHFEIKIITLGDTDNIIEDPKINIVDVIIVETTSYNENNVNFKIKSYFNNISNFKYDSIEQSVTFMIPFDWSEETMSHVPIVHEEIQFPKDFSDFLSPSYVGEANGVKLFKSSLMVDDYTDDDKRIVHFMLMNDHLRFVKNQMTGEGLKIPDHIEFTLKKSEESAFPLIALTRNEEFRVDLSWDPVTIEPGKKSRFIFTIRDAATGSPLRNSSYDFVIIQNGEEIFRESGNARVGGDFKDYTFSETQTGPTIIKFESIRGTDTETEFSLLVVPEFGTIVFLVFFVAMISILVFNNKFPLKINF